jgi:beta propeller repeat protein
MPSLLMRLASYTAIVLSLIARPTHAQTLTPPYAGANVYQLSVPFGDSFLLGIGDGGFRYPQSEHPSDPEAGILAHDAIVRTFVGVWPWSPYVSASSKYGMTAYEALLIPVAVPRSGRYTVTVHCSFITNYPLPSALDLAGVRSFGGNIVTGLDAAQSSTQVFAEFINLGGRAEIGPPCLQYNESFFDILNGGLLDTFLEVGDTGPLGSALAIADLVLPRITCVPYSHTLSFDVDLPQGSPMLRVGLISNLTSECVNSLGIGQGGHATEVTAFLRIDSIDLLATTDDCEPNESPVDPCYLGGLTAPFELPHLNIAAADTDWFSFSTIQTGGPAHFVSIDFSNAAGNLDMCLYRVNPGNPSDPIPVSCAQGDGNEEKIPLNGLAGGPFLIEVFGRSGATNPDYTLTIHPPSEQCEPGNFLSLGARQWDENGPDGDGCPECGEDIDLRVGLCSSTNIDYIDATLLGGSGVNVYDTEAFYGALASGTCITEGQFSMDVAACSGSRQVPFVVHTEYSRNGSLYCQDFAFNYNFREECTFGFETCGLEVVVEAVDDCDQDGVLESGEDGEIRLALRNLGDGTAIGAEAWLECIEDVELECGPNQEISFPDLSPGACEWPVSASHDWDVRVPKNTSGTFCTEVNVSYDGAAQPEPAGQICFDVAPQAWLDLQSNECDLGVTPTDGTATCQTSICNRGTAPLTVSGANITKPDGISVEIEPAPPWANIAPQLCMPITVRVTPSGFQGQLEPPISVSFQTSACVGDPGEDDLLQVTGLISDIPKNFQVPGVISAEDPDISGDWIVWEDRRFGNRDIFAYNICSGETVQVTDDLKDQRSPRISGNLIAWNDWRNWDGVTDATQFDVYGFDLANRSLGNFPIANDNSRHERIFGIDGNLVAFTSDYETLFDGDGDTREATTLFVYTYQGNGQFVLRYARGFSPGVGTNPRPHINHGSESGHGDFGDGLLVFEQRNWIWNPATSSWRSGGTGSDWHIEAMDFAAGDSNPRRAFSDFADLYAASLHSFAYAYDDTNGDGQIWTWSTSGTVQQVTQSEFDPGDDGLTVGREGNASYFVYDYRDSERPGLYSLDRAAGDVESLVSESVNVNQGAPRLDGATVVWSNALQGGGLFYAFLAGANCTSDTACDDGNACTTDTCLGRCCQHELQCSTDADCDNGVFCDGQETCSAAGCCVTGSPENCDDQVACTIDICDEASGSCSHIPDDALCSNGLYCDGVESCDVATGCVSGVPIACDDGVPCTEDLCLESTAACAYVPRHARCDNGVFCDGAERCDPVENCVPGDAPCPELLLCRESDDQCVVCLSDERCDNNLYCDGVESCNPEGNCEAGSGNPCDTPLPVCDELRDVCVECLGGTDCSVELPYCKIATNTCVQCLRDQDCDQSTFCDGVETCVEDQCVLGDPPCGEREYCDEENRVCVSTNGFDFAYRCVVVNNPSSEDQGLLPTNGVAQVGLGQAFFVEFWATDSEATNTGIVSAYTDLDYSDDVVACVSDPVHTPVFNLFTSGVCSGGMIDELGGTQFSSGLAIEPEWARVSYVEFSCDAVGTADFLLSPASSESSAYGRGLIPTDAIDYVSCSVECLGCPCTYDLDNNCNIAGGDLGWFAPCWLCQDGQACWDANNCEQKDFDCNGTVAGGDLGWFAAGWLKSCAELDPMTDFPPCRTCNGPIVCPWPSAQGMRATRDFANAPTVDEGVVRLALRLVRVPSQLGEVNRVVQSKLGTIFTGERIYAEVWVKDTMPGSDGLTAVFTDVRYDPSQLTAISVSPGSAFSLFADAVMDDAVGAVRRAGGATMEANKGVGTWSRVSVIEFEALSDMSRPSITVEPAGEEAISARGRGLVPSDRVLVVGRKAEAVAVPLNAHDGD